MPCNPLPRQRGARTAPLRRRGPGPRPLVAFKYNLRPCIRVSPLYTRGILVIIKVIKSIDFPLELYVQGVSSLPKWHWILSVMVWFLCVQQVTNHIAFFFASLYFELLSINLSYLISYTAPTINCRQTYHNM
jgi:hypothetical protein